MLSGEPRNSERAHEVAGVCVAWRLPGRRPMLSGEPRGSERAHEVVGVCVGSHGPGSSPGQAM
jgi:hypothetical protein